MARCLKKSEIIEIIKNGDLQHIEAIYHNGKLSYVNIIYYFNRKHSSKVTLDYVRKNVLESLLRRGLIKKDRTEIIYTVANYK